MSKTIYVKPNFKQQDKDEIIFSCASFVEILTQNVKQHKDYIFNISKEEVYKIKLDDCLNKREQEYKKLNQKELMFDDMVNGTKLWIEAIQEIKNKYPKPEPLEEQNKQGVEEEPKQEEKEK